MPVVEEEGLMPQQEPEALVVAVTAVRWLTVQQEQQTRVVEVVVVAPLLHQHEQAAQAAPAS